MKSYYVSQDNIHLWLDKNVKPAAADLFVEVVLFYLKAFVETHHLDLTVDSEKKIKPKPRSPVRPDICVKKGEAVVAIIECKTQLGWDRVNWQNNFIERELTLQEVYPDAHAFLVVLTSKNWGGLPLALKDGGQFFVLTNVWPSDINPDNLHDAIGNRIEPLFRQILALSENRPG